jgi:hypothetical protein
MAKRWTNSKEVNEMIDQVADQGWRIEDGGSAIKLWPADKSKGMVTVHKTPSDHRAVKNTRAQIRRAGGNV